MNLFIETNGLRTDTGRTFNTFNDTSGLIETLCATGHWPEGYDAVLVDAYDQAWLYAGNGEWEETT